MPFTPNEISFFESVVEFLNTLSSDQIRVFVGHADNFLEWLKNQDTNSLNIVSNYKPLKKIWIELDLTNHQILD